MKVQVALVVSFTILLKKIKSLCVVNMNTQLRHICVYICTKNHATQEWQRLSLRLNIPFVHTTAIITCQYPFMVFVLRSQVETFNLKDICMCANANSC